MKLEKIILLSIIFLFSNFPLIGDTITVDTTGTGNYTTIQEGINAAVDGDTVLVYPGTYYENINFNGKNITVASLYILTEADSFIHQTIIDGNQNGSVVQIVSGENENTLLCGFTIQNGLGSLLIGTGNYAGGIGIMDSNPKIKKCIIKNNTARSGGGIFCFNAQILLAGVTIFNNHAFNCGGGIILTEGSSINFNTEMLCNIYLNYSGKGCDFHKTWACPPTTITVDTFTVMNPDSYFITSIDLYGYPVNDVTTNILHAKIEPVNADLYVSPDGDNNNSGLTTDESLQTIAFALTKIASDSLHPNTIHIADGVYSPNVNDEKFPLNLRSYVSLAGESMNNTILDGEELSTLIQAQDMEKYYTIKNLTLTNGYYINWGAAQIRRNDNLLFENLKVISCKGSIGSGIEINETNNVVMKNMYIYDNLGGKPLRFTNGLEIQHQFIIENSIIKNNLPDYNPDIGNGGGILVGGRMIYPETNYGIIKNVEITNNVNNDTFWFGSSVALSVRNNAKVDVINATIGDNTTPTGGAIVLDWGAEVNIINSILYGDDPREIFLDNTSSEHPSTVTINNSLVQGGEAGIWDYGGFNYINWEEGNKDEDPFWVGTGDYPYALSANSPCIDAGNPDTTGLNLPPTDLAGNPRIYNGRIDMGAYEWQDTSAVNEPEYNNLNDILLQNYPNPFSSSTTISFNLKGILSIPMVFYKQINLEIYNVRGQLIRKFQIPNGKYQINEVVWDGKDEDGKKVPSGEYLYKLNCGEYSVAKKMLLIR